LLQDLASAGKKREVLDNHQPARTVERLDLMKTPGYKPSGMSRTLAGFVRGGSDIGTRLEPTLITRDINLPKQQL